jgi:16S rRNA C1402 (ribose-2'-O) methylase RsmI
MTKVYEQVINTTLADLAGRFSGETKGEITLVVAGRTGKDEQEIPADFDRTIATYLDQGMSPRDISRILTKETNLSRKLIYQRILKVKRADLESTKRMDERVDG